MEDIRYKNFDDFYRIYEKVASLKRTCMSASDYEKFMEQQGKPVSVEILLKAANDFPINDLFMVNGKLQNVKFTLKNKERWDSWDASTVYQAYKNVKNGPNFNYGNYIYSIDNTSSIIRSTIHKLDDLIHDDLECNLLVSHSNSMMAHRFFNTAIPAHEKDFSNY